MASRKRLKERNIKKKKRNLLQQPHYIHFLNKHEAEIIS